MKKLIFLLPLALVFQACTFYDYETQFDERDRVVGYYDVEEYSATYDDMTWYTMRISKSGYGSRIYFHNFYGAELTVSATLRYGRIVIPYQVVDGYEIEGEGTVYGNEMDLDYSVTDLYSNTYTDYCESRAWMEY